MATRPLDNAVSLHVMDTRCTSTSTLLQMPAREMPVGVEIDLDGHETIETGVEPVPIINNPGWSTDEIRHFRGRHFRTYSIQLGL